MGQFDAESGGHFNAEKGGQFERNIQQCPYAGGKAVYLARNFISKYYTDTIEYNDVVVCLQQGISRQSENNTTRSITTNDFTLKPNPANDKIEIAIKNKVKGICNLEIVNNLGETIQRLGFDCEVKNQLIDVNNLKPGLYSVQITFNKEYRFVSKLAIIR